MFRTEQVSPGGPRCEGGGGWGGHRTPGIIFIAQLFEIQYILDKILGVDLAPPPRVGGPPRDQILTLPLTPSGKCAAKLSIQRISVYVVQRVNH